jgi:hypothetical protein
MAENDVHDPSRHFANPHYRIAERPSVRDVGAGFGRWRGEERGRTIPSADVGHRGAIGLGIRLHWISVCKEFAETASWGLTPNRLARSAGIMSAGPRSKLTPARCKARAMSATQPCWPRSGIRNQSPARSESAISTKLKTPYFWCRQAHA